MIEPPDIIIDIIALFVKGYKYYSVVVCGRIF